MKPADQTAPANPDTPPATTPAPPNRTLSNLARMRYTIGYPAPEPDDVKAAKLAAAQDRPVTSPYTVTVTSSHPDMIKVVPDSPTGSGLAASGWLVGQKAGRTQTGVVITASFARQGRPVREVKESIDLVDTGGGLAAFPEFGFGDVVAL